MRPNFQRQCGVHGRSHCQGRVHGRGHGLQRNHQAFVGGRGHRSDPSQSYASSTEIPIPRDINIPHINIPQAASQRGRSPTPRQYIATEPTAVKALEQAFKEVTTFDPDKLVRHGLPIFGFNFVRQDSVRYEENIERFREHYGARSKTVAAILNDLIVEYPEKWSTKEALMTFTWLKLYGTERTIAGPWNVGCLRYLRNTVKGYTVKIASLAEKKIIFGPFDEGDLYPYDVDGMHCATSKICSFAYMYICTSVHILCYANDSFQMSSG